MNALTKSYIYGYWFYFGFTHEAKRAVTPVGVMQ